MPSPRTSDHVPNFELPDQKGNSWILRERLRSGPVVLVFYRGDW
jgi:peroxiredoxin